jgi:hypothetical protein
MSNLLGIKKILTYKLINIIRPFFYEGVLSIYLDAANISNSDKVLMVFQGLLSRIPKWSDAEIVKEVERIKGKCNCPYFDNLLRSVIKINISIFLDETKDTFVESSLYEKITLKEFVHKTYILIARKIFNNPILFYSELKDIDKLKNMNRILSIIGDEIENSIIELLPLDYLIDEFLNVDIYDKQLNLKIPNNSINNLEQMKKKVDLLEPINDIRIKLVEGANNIKSNLGNIQNNIGNLTNPMINNGDPHILPIIPVNGKQLFPVQMGGNKRKSTNKSKRRTKYSEDDSSRTLSTRSTYSKGNSSSDRIQKNVKKFLSNSKYDESAAIDNIIKRKHKEVKNMSDTSVSYDIDNADRFQEVFSNDREIRNIKQTHDVKQTNQNILKKKNYLNFTNSGDNNLFTNNSRANNNRIKKGKTSRNYRHFHKV